MFKGDWGKFFNFSLFHLLFFIFLSILRSTGYQCITHIFLCKPEWKRSHFVRDPMFYEHIRRSSGSQFDMFLATSQISNSLKKWEKIRKWYRINLIEKLYKFKTQKCWKGDLETVKLPRHPWWFKLVISLLFKKIFSENNERF